MHSSHFSLLYALGPPSSLRCKMSVKRQRTEDAEDELPVELVKALMETEDHLLPSFDLDLLRQMAIVAFGHDIPGAWRLRQAILAKSSFKERPIALPALDQGLSEEGMTSEARAVELCSLRECQRMAENPCAACGKRFCEACLERSTGYVGSWCGKCRSRRPAPGPATDVPPGPIDGFWQNDLAFEHDMWDYTEIVTSICHMAGFRQSLGITAANSATGAMRSVIYEFVQRVVVDEPCDMLRRYRTIYTPILFKPEEEEEEQQVWWRNPWLATPWAMYLQMREALVFTGTCRLTASWRQEWFLYMDTVEPSLRAPKRTPWCMNWRDNPFLQFEVRARHRNLCQTMEAPYGTLSFTRQPVVKNLVCWPLGTLRGHVYDIKLSAAPLEHLGVWRRHQRLSTAPTDQMPRLETRSRRFNQVQASCQFFWTRASHELCGQTCSLCYRDCTEGCSRKKGHSELGTGA